MFALSLYTVTHKFTLSLLAHKGKCKGDCGERNYLCISTEGGRETLCRLVNVKGKCYSKLPGRNSRNSYITMGKTHHYKSMGTAEKKEVQICCIINT